VARRGRQGSCGSSDVFFEIIFGHDLGMAVGQHLDQFIDDADDLFTVELRTNPNDETGNAIHGSASASLF